MNRLKLLMKIEIKNRNLMIYLLSFVVVYLLLAFIISKTRGSDLNYSILNLSTLIYFIFGLIFSLILLESLKNEQTAGLVKTFSVYPVSAANYIISKLLTFTIIFVISLLIGSIFSAIVIFPFSQTALDILVCASVFTVLSSIAMFALVSLFSRFSIISEVVLVMYYFIIFFTALSSVNINETISIVPFLYIAPKFIGISTAQNLMNIISYPLFYIIALILAISIIYIFDWKVFYKVR